MSFRLCLYVLAAAVIGASLTGCAGTLVFRPDDGRFTRRHLDGRTATVTLRDGRSYRVAALRVSADSVVWADPATLRFNSVPVGDVARLTVQSPRLTVSRSALRGALVGGAVGVVMGATAGYESGPCLFFCQGEPTSSERVRGVLVLGALVGLQGAGSGALYGTIGGGLFPADWEFVPAPPAVAYPSARNGAATAPPRPF